MTLIPPVRRKNMAKKMPRNTRSAMSANQSYSICASLRRPRCSYSSDWLFFAPFLTMVIVNKEKESNSDSVFTFKRIGKQFFFEIFLKLCAKLLKESRYFPYIFFDRSHVLALARRIRNNRYLLIVEGGVNWSEVPLSLILVETLVDPRSPSRPVLPVNLGS